MSFDASNSSDSDPTAALQARWDWEGDGAWDTPLSSDLTAQHAFPEARTYQVRLEIEDSNGLANVTGDVLVVSRVASGVGAPPGFGLTDPSGLVPHAPIYIGRDADFTLVNGVRQGKGTPGDPYVISNWSFDGNLYPNAQAMIWVENTSKYVTIENDQLVNLTGNDTWAGIELGRWPAIVNTSNATIRHNLVDSQHAYGIKVNEGSRNVRVEANSVSLNADLDWVYGAVAMRGTHNVTFYGNYVNAFTNASYHTVGIHLSDYFVSEARDATGLVAERNTVANATAGGIVSESSHGTVIRGNLVYMDYPGPKSVAFNYPRGIETEWLSNETIVVGNLIHTFHWGIQVGSDRDRIYSNTIYDVDYAVYVPDNGSWEGISSYDDTIYNTTYWSVAKEAFRLPASPRINIMDVGPGIRSTNFTSVLLLANRTPTQVGYSWSGQQLNVSAVVGGDVIYDTALAAESQTLHATWSGSVAVLSLERFVPANVSFQVQSGTDVVIDGFGFVPSVVYSLNRSTIGGAVTILRVNSTSTGSLHLTIPAAPASTYSIMAGEPVDTLPPVTVCGVAGSLGSGGWYTSRVNMSLNATDAGSGVATIHFRMDGGPWQLYTAPVEVQTDGVHEVEYYATDHVGNNETIQSATIPIDQSHPVTSSSVSGTLATNGSYVDLAKVTLTASDATSGVASIQDRVDGGLWQGYSGPILLAGNGTHTIEYFATDHAGNVESPGSISIRVFGLPVGPPGVPPNPTPMAPGPSGGLLPYVGVGGILALVLLAAALLVRRRRESKDR